MVSHGHGAQVEQLLASIGKWSDSRLQKVTVTVNDPDLDKGFFIRLADKLPFELCIINNSQPRGFGTNHNRAFLKCGSDYFFVLNPDLELPENPFPALLEALSSAKTGCAYPVQTSSGGALQEFERALPTPIAIAKRRVRGFSNQSNSAAPPQWVSGAFMAFNSSVFRSLGGFDERYFMYCEDADICLRLQLAGFYLARADTTVVHHAQRQTTKSLRHLAWHVRSLLRLWNSQAYKAYKYSIANH